MAAYRRAVGKFITWLMLWNVWPCDVGQLDDLLVEWKNQVKELTKSQFAQAICGIELCIPTARRQLIWARSVLSDWEVVNPPQHHLPLPRGALGTPER